jgi:hypothetical protein
MVSVTSMTPNYFTAEPYYDWEVRRRERERERERTRCNTKQRLSATLIVSLLF